jgi:phosphatidate phosphatase APP1
VAARLHLIVAWTDAEDGGSSVDSPRVLDVARRSESVLHLVMMTRASATVRPGVGYFLPVRGVEPGAKDRLKQAAALTGGRVHDRIMGSPDPVDAFQEAFEDSRTSYVLTYTPARASSVGWHAIKLEVPSVPGATIRARRGYFGR